MSDEDTKPWTLRLKPRAWQEEALRAWAHQQRGVVSVVTGGGKTILAQMCMLSFRQSYPEGRVIILLPTITLLDQWFVSLQEELGVPRDDIACFYSQERSSKPRLVNLLVINSARQLAPIVAADSDTFLIVDECHRAGSPANAMALRIQPKAALGLSATPVREYDNGFESRVSPVLGDIIYRYDYVQAHRDGVVTPFQLLNVRVALLHDEAVKYASLSRKAAAEVRRLAHESGSQERLKRILQSRAAVAATAAMRIPVAAKLVEQNRARRTIVFHERVKAANAIVSLLNKREHLATAYHSQVGPAIRRDNLRLFRRGVFDVLVTCRALDEGLNVPETTVGIIASSTASTRQRIQRLGRVLRPAPGKDCAAIYTIYATRQEERRLREEQEGLQNIASVSWLKGQRVAVG